MNDRQIIDQAYANQVQNLFTVLWAAYSTGSDSETAESHFKTGLALLRKCRDRAIANI